MLPICHLAALDVLWEPLWALLRGSGGLFGASWVIALEVSPFILGMVNENQNQANRQPVNENQNQLLAWLMPGGCFGAVLWGVLDVAGLS